MWENPKKQDSVDDLKITEVISLVDENEDDIPQEVRDLSKLSFNMPITNKVMYLK